MLPTSDTYRDTVTSGYAWFSHALETSTSFAQIWFDFAVAVGQTLRSDVPLGVSLSTVELASVPAQATPKRMPSTCAAQTTVNLTPQVITKRPQTIERVADQQRSSRRARISTMTACQCRLQVRVSQNLPTNLRTLFDASLAVASTWDGGRIRLALSARFQKEMAGRALWVWLMDPLRHRQPTSPINADAYRCCAILNHAVGEGTIAKRWHPSAEAKGVSASNDGWHDNEICDRERQGCGICFRCGLPISRTNLSIPAVHLDRERHSATSNAHRSVFEALCGPHSPMTTAQGK
jgi:hypothetical protein